MTLQVATASSWNGLAVYIRTLAANGNCQLNLTFFAREAAFPNEGAVSTTDAPSLTTVTWTPGAATIKAFQKCNPFYENVNASFWNLAAALADFKNRPDPVPDPVYWEVNDIIRAVQALQKAAAQFARASSLTEAEVLERLSVPDFLRSQDPPPAELDLRRFQPTSRLLPIATGVHRPTGQPDESKGPA